MNAEILGKCPGHPYSHVHASTLCKLWKGYGKLLQVHAKDWSNKNVNFVVKEVDIPPSSGEDHLRKVKSYKVESIFYKELSKQMNERDVVVPELVHVEDNLQETEGSMSIVLSDLTLDRQYYTLSGLSMDLREAEAVLTWLAKFHAMNWQREIPAGLWTEGSFWQLGTRTRELADMMDEEWSDLKAQAGRIHEKITGSRFRTVIHGDAKSANFFFYNDVGNEIQVSGFDFQYCGGGDPMRDVAYLLSCSVQPSVLEQRGVGHFLKHYHSELTSRLDTVQATEYTFLIVQQQFDVCLADLVRFMAGSRWWGNIEFSEQNTKKWLHSQLVNTNSKRT